MPKIGADAGAGRGERGAHRLQGGGRLGGGGRDLPQRRF